MKLKISKLLILISLFMLTASCFDTLPKIFKRQAIESVDQIQVYEDKVVIKYDINYMRRSFNKKMIIDFTPIVIINADTIRIKSFEICGEDACSDGNIVSFEYGGKINISDTIPYNMRIESLEIVSGSKARFICNDRELQFLEERIFLMIDN